MKTIDQLKRYFGIKVIGSYLFVEKGYLEESDINDIDIVVESTKDSENLRLYLTDKGYNETQKPIKYQGYSGVEGSNLFKKDNELPIHILISPRLEVVPLKTIIAEKWDRRTKSDLEQLKKIIEKTKGA